MRGSTPPEVIDAIQVVGRYLAIAKYGSVIIAPGGGASFHIRNVLDEKGDLFREITRLEAELSGVRAQLTQALASASASSLAVSRAQRVCFVVQENRAGQPQAVLSALLAWEVGR